MRFLVVGLLFALTALPTAAEVWNEPSGVAVTATSQTVTFPRPMTSVAFSNDDATNEFYLRLFSCNEKRLYLDATLQVATTLSLEIQAGNTRSFTTNRVSEPFLYCAVSVVCASAETATVRIEAK